MFGLVVLLLACSSAVFGESLSNDYVRSNEVFLYAKNYLNLRLAPQNGEPNINTETGRTHHSFGVLTDISAALVSIIDITPLDIIYIELPYAWNHYGETSRKALDLLNEASDKVTLITDLINSCGAASVEQCNKSIDQKVEETPEIYKDSAELMLLLGAAGRVIRKNANILDAITEQNREISYLLKHVENEEFHEQLRKLKDAYDKIQAIQMRRSGGSQ